jgi:Kef-type K+ transport system membrane component KefB
MSASELAVAFFLQVAVILGACRLVGALARRVGQPQVVGEMIAGVLLGPSLLGLLFPEIQVRIFPRDSLRVLYVGAQLGVGLYMFLVGVEFKTELFRNRLRSALSVSLAGMLVPFALGTALVPWLLTIPGLFSSKATMWEAMLFLAAAMSITAFPMLARIIYERGLTGSALGTLALAAGCIDDAAAWCVLAIVLASFGGGPVVAITAIGGGAVYAVTMITLGRRMLAGLETSVQRAGAVTPTHLGIVLMLFMIASWITDAIGMHTVFGGFILGTAMPRGLITRELTRQLEPVAVVLLLPMFFTFSGLNTRLDMVDSVPLLLVALTVLLAACFGKGETSPILAGTLSWTWPSRTGCRRCTRGDWDLRRGR